MNGSITLYLLASQFLPSCYASVAAAVVAFACAATNAVIVAFAPIAADHHLSVNLKSYSAVSLILTIEAIQQAFKALIREDHQTKN